MFDGGAPKFWNKEDDQGKFDEIDSNDFINWDEVNDKALKEMKERYPKGNLQRIWSDLFVTTRI